MANFGAKKNTKAETKANGSQEQTMLVENWYGKCFSVKQPNDDCVILNTQLGSRKRKDGDGYINGLNVSIFVSLNGDNPTEIAEDDYEGANILVSGRFSVDEWTNPKTNETQPQYKIFATKVVKREDNRK